jgi:hypothetical protein
MPLSWEMSCDDCDDDTIILRFEKSGKTFVHSWYQCVHCGTTDWQQKTRKKFTIFKSKKGGE